MGIYCLQVVHLLCFRKDDNYFCKNRTIMALWKTRTLSPEEKAEIAEDQQAEIAEEQHNQDGESTLPDEGTSSIVEDVTMSKIYSAEIPVNVSC